MNYLSYLEHLEQLPLFEQMGVKELLLGHRQLSRLGELQTENMIFLMKECRKRKIEPILEWDILMTQQVLTQAEKVLSLLPMDEFRFIRVQDPGALQLVMDKYPHLKIQLNLESGNHNLVGIQEWCSYVGDRLERVVLSLEIPIDRLKSYLPELTVPVEILVLGKNLLFYTPRSLLSPLKPGSGGQEKVVARAKSEEGPHKKFFLVENQHGTFMFHPKELFLLESLAELQEIGLSHCRLDFRFGKTLEFQKEILQWVTSANFSLASLQALKEQYPGEVFRGLFKVNKSDVLFPKLKNQHLQRQDSCFLGEILEVEKGKYAAILLKNKNRSLIVPSEIEIRNPKGELIQMQLKEMKDSKWQSLSQGENGQVVFINYAKGMSAQSAVYQKQ